MNRTQYMTAVYETNLDPVDRSILVYLGFRKNWKEGTFAWPSAKKVSRDTGWSIATVKRKMPELRAKGYLSDTGQRRGRGVIVYDLVDPTGITVIPQQHQSDTKGYQSDTAEASERCTEQVLNEVQEQVTEQVPEDTKEEGTVEITSNDSILLGLTESTSLVEENSNGTLHKPEESHIETVQERLVRIRETQARFAPRRRTA